MNIGNFEDFLATLSLDVIEQILSDARLKSEQVLEDADLSKGSYSANQVAAIAFTCSLELLGLYHKWIDTESGQDHADLN